MGGAATILSKHQIVCWLLRISVFVFINSVKAQASLSCPMCVKPIVPSRAVYAVLSVKGQKHRLKLRCIVCALNAVKRWQPETALLRTRCVATKRWVTFKWDGDWQSEPKMARLLIAPEAGNECLHRHLVFASPSVAHRFVQKRPSLRSFPLLTIAEVK